MEPKILKSEEDYQAALVCVDRLMDAKPGTRKMEQLELWTLLIKNYEDQHYPIDPPTPLAAIRFRMEQQGLRQSDLIPFIGSKSRVSEVMHGKRALTLAMIRKLHEGLGISLEVLVQKQAKPRRPAVKKNAMEHRNVNPRSGN